MPQRKKIQVSLNYFFRGGQPQPVLQDVRPERGRPPVALRAALEQADKELQELRLLYDSQAGQRAEQRRKAHLRSKGGRPPQAAFQRGTASGLSSNRRMSWHKQLRRDIPVASKLMMAEEMEGNMSSFSCKSEFWRAHCKKYGMTKKQLFNILKKKDEWAKLKQAHKLGSAEFGAGQAQGLRQRPNSLRRRAAGAGAKRKLAWAVAKISHWLSLERAYGHCISKAQFIQQYIRELTQRAT